MNDHSWLKAAEIPSGDRSRFEHHLLSAMLETAVAYDSLQVSNLACFELLARRLQHIEAAHVGNPNAPDYEGTSHYMGSAEKRGGALIAPALSVHVAGKFRDEAAANKEIRKAKESTRPQATPPYKGKDDKDKKGKGKGDDKGKGTGAPGGP